MSFQAKGSKVLKAQAEFYSQNGERGNHQQPHGIDAIGRYLEQICYGNYLILGIHNLI